MRILMSLSSLLKKTAKLKKTKLRENIKSLNIMNIDNRIELESCVDKLASIFKNIWSNYTKTKRVTKVLKK